MPEVRRTAGQLEALDGIAPLGMSSLSGIRIHDADFVPLPVPGAGEVMHDELGAADPG